MFKLLDVLTFRRKAALTDAPPSPEDIRCRREERDAALVTDRYPPDAADVESLSEYRLASLMQYPHY